MSFRKCAQFSWAGTRPPGGASRAAPGALRAPEMESFAGSRNPRGHAEVDIACYLSELAGSAAVPLPPPAARFRRGRREPKAGGPPWSAPQGARGGGRFCRQGHALATSDVHGFPLGHRRPEKQEEEEEEEEGGKGRRWRRRKTGRLSPSENSPLRRAERVPPFAATAAPEKQRDGATASCARACRHDREDAPLESTSAPHGEAGAA
ncbi:unnamed protein product [Prorocentrum cordatum]|uniref:Uncharacterized protein n=1 Tax=Prorocentrum cordatum TaxID=2364126 RepID=A0ABN9WPR1_9DINO|nr:unnamed protein product [Polarella glacialis]